jgi:hypothetical protein
MSDGRQTLTHGRIVWCVGRTPFDGSQRKDATGRLLTNTKGEPAMQYGFGLAVPKPGPTSTPEETKNFMDLWNAIQSEAMALYPTGQVPPGFSYKYKDGDGVDHNGRPFSQREGYAGHLIFAVTTSIPLRFVKYDGAYVEIKDGIKCGDYVQVQINVKGHLPKPGTQSKPGLYLNPNVVLFLGYGKEIVNAPDAASVFGAAPPPMPAGASATPVGGPANFGAFAQPTPEQPAMPQAPAAPAWGGQPNPNVLPPAFQQVAPAMPQAPAPSWGAPQQAMPQAPAMQQPGVAPRPPWER